MSNTENWDNVGEDTEPIDVSEIIKDDAVWEAPVEETPAEPETKSEELAADLGIEATIAEDNPDAVAEENNVIGSSTSAKGKGTKKPALTPNSGGVISSGSVDSEPKPKKEKSTKKTAERVAVFSTRNVTWSGVGKVYRGYNIVTKDQAADWLERDHIRLATPEEIANEFGEEFKL